MKLEEIKQSSEIIYKGKIITVKKDKVLCPNGNLATREIVNHNRGVGILAIKNEHIIFAQQYRYAVNDITLEIPAGKLEKDEDPMLCAFRELEEETDYRAQKMILINKFYPTPGYDNELLYIYEAKNIEKVNDSLEADTDEFINVIKIPIDKAYQLVLENKIIDAKTVIAVMYAYINKNKK